MRGVLDIPEHLGAMQDLVLVALARVEARFDTQLDSDLPPVGEMCAHIEQYRGKMLRPTLVVLCGAAVRDDLAERIGARDFGSVATERHATAGAVCEMVHMATLVHDDVLDEAGVRRGRSTVNALRGNEQAVILGDYLIASAYELCSSFDSSVPARIIGRASTVMCAGELLQLHHRENASLDEATYFEVLQRKTAALIGASCELGALCTLGFERTDDAKVGAVGAFGRLLGVAFQVQDDLLDLTGEETVLGKPVRQDIERGKLTYPLIHHLAHADPRTRGRTLRLIEGGLLSGEMRDALPKLLDSTGSLDAARRTSHRLVGEAKQALGALPHGPGKEMLMMMSDAVIDRAF